MSRGRAQDIYCPGRDGKWRVVRRRRRGGCEEWGEGRGRDAIKAELLLKTTTEEEETKAKWEEEEEEDGGKVLLRKRRKRRRRRLIVLRRRRLRTHRDEESSELMDWRWGRGRGGAHLPKRSSLSSSSIPFGVFPSSDLLTRRGRRALTLERMEGGGLSPISSFRKLSLSSPREEEDGGRKKFLDSTTYVVEVGGGGEERESLSPSFSPRKRRRRDQGEKRGSLYLDFYLPGGERGDHSSQSRGRPPPSNIYLFPFFLFSLS